MISVNFFYSPKKNSNTHLYLLHKNTIVALQRYMIRGSYLIKPSQLISRTQKKRVEDGAFGYRKVFRSLVMALQPQETPSETLFIT